MTNEEGYLGIVIIIGMIFLIIIPSFFGILTTLMYYFFNRIIKNRKTKITIILFVLAISLISILTMPLTPLIGPPLLLLIAIIACSQLTAVTLFENQYKPYVNALIIFISTIICSGIILFIYISIISIPAYSNQFARIQFVIYYIIGLLIWILVFLAIRRIAIILNIKLPVR
jgi:hypothetical protein